jgi:chorismate mutase
MKMRGVRGAITVPENTADAILSGTRSLLKAIIDANHGLQPEDLCSVIFTVTNDLSAAFPAKAARDLGWNQVPLMCMSEIPVSGALPMCIRVLVHWNTDKKQEDIRHIYLENAAILRPDLSLETQNR